MVFSNENITKFRDKKSVPMIQDSMSKVSTALSLSDAANSIVEKPKSDNDWIFGIKCKAYPYNLLMTVGECLKEMGFV